MVTITKELAEDLDAIRLSIFDTDPETETDLALWMVRAGFRDAFGMEHLPDTTPEALESATEERVMRDAHLDGRVEPSTAKVVERVGVFTLVHDPERGYRWSHATEPRGKRTYWDPDKQAWTRRGAWSETRDLATRGLKGGRKNYGP